MVGECPGVRVFMRFDEVWMREGTADQVVCGREGRMAGSTVMGATVAGCWELVLNEWNGPKSN